MNQIIWTSVSKTTIILYNIILILGLLFFIFKYMPNCVKQKDSLLLLIIILFFSGLFGDLSDCIINNHVIINVYKIVVLVWSFFLFINSGFLLRNFRISLLFIIIFSLYFLIDSIAIHNDSYALALSQLSKFLIPFFIAPSIYASIAKSSMSLIRIDKLFKELIIFQILLAFVKLMLLGGYFEGWVGSISGFKGGAAGTSLPLLVLCYISLRSNMRFTFNDILIILGSLFIGFMTGKRAIWFLFPLLFILLYLFVFSGIGHGHSHKVRTFITTLLIGVLLFYVGLRVSPTLNPDGKVWGRFDPSYAFSYSLSYSAGRESFSEQQQKGEGRVGAVALMFDELPHIREIPRIAVGVGNEYMVYADIGEYENPDYYFGVNYRGGITGIVGMYFTIGIIGVVLFLLYLLSLFPYIKYTSFRIVLLLLVLFDFVFYVGQIVNNPVLFIFLMFIMIYSNNRYDRRGYVMPSGYSKQSLCSNNPISIVR